MDDDSANYQAYLLRIWRVQEAQGHLLRLSLQPIPAGSARGFADLHELFAYLEGQTNLQQPTNAAAEDECAAE